MEQYDLIIIGGGLAGLSLSIQQATAKRKVLLIEKNKYPFHRVCGEYISMESWKYLERLGLPISQMNLPKISRLKITSENGKYYSGNLDLGGFGVSRFTIDFSLAQLAKKVGVELIEDTTVNNIRFLNNEFTVEAGVNIFQTKIVVGAFGKRSNLDKKLNRRVANSYNDNTNWVGVKYHIKSDLPGNEIQLHNFSGGYCGVSKVDDGMYCLCYITKAENLRKFNGDIFQMEEKVLSINPFLKKIFSNRGQFVFGQPVTISQISFEKKLPVENHVIMIGDSAGMIAPLFGNGMSMAMRAANMANELILQYQDKLISRNEMEINYLKRWNKQFSFHLAKGRMLQPILMQPKLSNVVVPFFKAFPFIASQIVKSTHGKEF